MVCAVDAWLNQFLGKEALSDAISFESTDGSDGGIRRANYASNKGVNMLSETEDSQFLSGSFDKSFVYGTNCMAGVWALPNNKAFWGNVQELALTEQLVCRRLALGRAQKSIHAWLIHAHFARHPHYGRELTPGFFLPKL